MQEIEAMIGDGVTVRGSESLIREAMGVPDDVLDVPSFLRSLAIGEREDVVFDAVDALFGGLEPSPPEAQDEEMATAVVELACRLKAVEEALSLSEAETKDELEPWDDRCRRWRTDAQGRVRFVPRSEKAILNEPRFVPGARVWDVGTGDGPWVLIRPGTMKIPVELPPFDGDDPIYSCPAVREVEVNAWVIEVSPWFFQMVPEACLDPEGRPIELSDEMVAILEQEAAEEAQADLVEMTNPGWGCADEALRAQTEEIKKMRVQTTRAIYSALAASGALLGPLLWWLTQNIG